VFRLNAALETEATVNIARDQVRREMIEATSYDLSRNSSTRTATSYWEPDYHGYVLPADPDRCRGGTTETDDVYDITSIESRSDSGIFLDISPSEAETASYSGLSSATREPSPPPQVYDELTASDYCNVSEAHNALNSAKQLSASGIDLNISPSEAEAASYSRLRSSTRKPSPTPQVYDELAKPDYYNINDANN